VRTGLVFWKYDPAAGTWALQEQAGDGEAVAVGEDVSVASLSRDSGEDNALWLFRDGYLVPDSQEITNAECGCVTTEVLRTKPAMFDSSGLTVDQYFAESLDGTKIPYFVMRPKGLVFDGSNPTLLDAYGGFEISMLPGYSAGVGAGWLERGGVKVIANIRGGGEYGPKWHQAALKEHRHKAYEDMEAVGQDLVTRKITSPAKLAVIGGSNGGLMVGNMITRPISSALFGAAVCQVPLLDMKSYSHLLAGASWMAEYGDPDTADWKFLRDSSAYHKLRHDCIGIPEGTYTVLHYCTALLYSTTAPHCCTALLHRTIVLHYCTALLYSHYCILLTLLYCTHTVVLALSADDAEADAAAAVGVSVPRTPKNPGWRCPTVLFTTSTRDDRVHPAHARKMVRSLTEEATREQAPNVYYWENVEGGHGGAADNKQRAHMWALTYGFLAKTLGLTTSSL
jgi:prolyl oligopeptidase PreP (S9A serine peptidase family)